jgi:glutamine synthetase
MFADFDDAAAYIRDNNIRMIDLKFADLWGRWRHVTLPATQSSPRLMRDDLGFDGSSVGPESVKAGGPGQCEIETPMMRGAVATGDMIMKVKYVTKMVAHAAGKTTSFMPKPLFGEAGNGMHFHQQLFKEGTHRCHRPSSRLSMHWRKMMHSCELGTCSTTS